MMVFGSDPEFMLMSREGELVSAIGKVKGTKEKKINLGDGNQLFYDNVLMELNIRPSYSREEAVENIANALRLAYRHVHPLLMTIRGSAEYPATECKHPDAKVFGCEPEYCAYDLKQIQAPSCVSTFRSAGGHIHLGDNENKYPLMAAFTDDDRHERDWGRIWVIRCLDLFVGIPSIILDRDPTSAARRKLYGRAGTHRPKEEYGIEYRATGNFWLVKPAMVELIYDICSHVIEFVGNNDYKSLWKDEDTCTAYDVQELRDTINDSDVSKAKDIMEKVVKKHMPNKLFFKIFQFSEDSGMNNFYRDWGIA